MRTPRPTRRELLAATPLALTSLCSNRAQTTRALPRLRVVETAGLRRFGYPVSVALPGPPQEKSFRLLKNGQPVPAQFQRVNHGDGGTSVVLDFNSSLGPFESEEYTVEPADGQEQAPQRARGLQCQELPDTFQIAGSGSAYDVPKDLNGLLARVSHSGKDYLRAQSPGLWIRAGRLNSDSAIRPWPPLSGSLTRHGPLAIALRFSGNCPLDDGRSVALAVDLTIPSSKSWVQVALRVDDQDHGAVTELGLDLDLAVEGSPTLVDFGAAGTVYGTLREDERLIMSARPLNTWDVSKTTPRGSSLHAASAPVADPKSSRPAEGWAHLMDSTRCTALAVAQFGWHTFDRIELDARGRVRVARRFTEPRRDVNSMIAWFHFVSIPVQVGALTSPQSMLAPLQVEWL